MFFCNNTIDDARRQKRRTKNIKKANMIKSRIVLFGGRSIILWTLCQWKMFFSWWKREKEKKIHSKKREKREREKQTKTTKLHIGAKIFSFFLSTAKTAARVEKKRERKKGRRGVSLLLGTGNIKASRETEKLSALRQNAISSESFYTLSFFMQ